MGNKRKGDSAAVSLVPESLSRSVVFSPRDPNAAFLTGSTAAAAATAKETACRKQLQSILQLIESHNKNNNNNDSDPVLVTLLQATAVRKHSLPHRLQVQLDAAATARKQLSSQIAQTRSHWQRQHQESAALQTQRQALQQQATILAAERHERVQQSHQLSREMQQLRQLLAASQQTLQQLQQQRRVNVPRLQYQISLFASMTGIKWDFAAQEQQFAKDGDDHGGGGGETHWLIGLMKVPSQHTVRRFQIDRRDYNDFEIATMLWSMMNGERESEVL